MVALKSVTVLFLLTLLATPVPAEVKHCAVDGPASVLTCLEKAYAERDLDLLEALYAPDYQFFFGQGRTSMGRAEDLEMTAAMFTAPDVREIDLKLEGEYTTSEGPEAGTWVLDGVTATLRIEHEQQFQVVIEGIRILVREVPGPEPHFVIVEWREPRRE